MLGNMIGARFLTPLCTLRRACHELRSCHRTLRTWMFGLLRAARPPARLAGGSGEGLVGIARRVHPRCRRSAFEDALRSRSCPTAPAARALEPVQWAEHAPLPIRARSALQRPHLAVGRPGWNCRAR